MVEDNQFQIKQRQNNRGRAKERNGEGEMGGKGGRMALRELIMCVWSPLTSAE